MTAVRDQTESAQQQSDEALKRFVDGFSSPRRSPVLHSPSEHGLEFEDVTFPAHDGVPLEAWFVPAPGSSKLIIANHPLGFSRSGIPTTFSRGMPRGRPAVTDSKWISYPTTRSCTTPDITSSPTTCATMALAVRPTVAGRRWNSR
jgi:hypothetical protein